MASLRLRHWLRSRTRSERGAEIIELAIVSPIFALLIAAMFDFGFLFRNWEVVTNAAREGARIGTLPSYACDGSTSDVNDRVTAYLTSSGISSGSISSINLYNRAVATASGTFNACVVTIEVTQSLPTLSFFGSMFGGGIGNVPVRGAAVMRTEAQGAP
jgi:Flp pilus assembly protein TadG